MVEAIKTSKILLATSPWQDLGIRPYGPLSNATTDNELADYARSQIETFWHASCTVKMGTADDEMAVLDSNLKVKGVKGLRVVDASVFVSNSPDSRYVCCTYSG